MADETIEKWYEKVDPWGYRTNPEDAKRKQKILAALNQYGKFRRALEIGCGEGFIAEELPARTIYGLEESDIAASRLAKNVKRIKKLSGKYDLILCTGILYAHYEVDKFLDMVRNHASKIVLTCNIATWEVNDLPKEKIVYEEYFAYREFEQHLVVYQW